MGDSRPQGGCLKARDGFGGNSGAIGAGSCCAARQSSPVSPLIPSSRRGCCRGASLKSWELISRCVQLEVQVLIRVPVFGFKLIKAEPEPLWLLRVFVQKGTENQGAALSAWLRPLRAEPPAGAGKESGCGGVRLPGLGVCWKTLIWEGERGWSS